MVKSVVILGGSYAGLHIAHYLLKQRLSDVKVILVSKSSHLYWNMASVRAIVPGQIADDSLFQPLAAALERYPQESYELIIGKAEKVDASAKTVLVSPSAGGATEQRTLPYDQLVVATGSRCTSSDVPWKVLDSHAATVARLDQTRERVQAAHSIVVAGAGATGVEVAGELAFEYGGSTPASASKKDAPKKEITLLAGGPSVLDGDSIGLAARAELLKLGVKLKTNARVLDTKELPDGRTQISLHNGETLTADLYLPTMGMQANTQMLENKYLTEHGFVAVDECCRVTGLENVWAAGDVVSKPRGGFLITQKQAAGVAKNVELALQGKAPQTVKLLPVDIMACAVGRNRGAGRMGPVKMLSVMVWLAKGKTLGIQRMPSYIDGSVA